MSEVKYEVWRWNGDSNESNKFDYSDDVERFIKIVEKQGYTSLTPFYENVGYVDDGTYGDNDKGYYRASVIYYKAIPNETDTKKYMNLSNSIETNVSIIDNIGHQGAGETWHIDDNTDIFDSGLDRLGENLTSYLNAGYIITNITPHKYEDKEEDTIELTFNVELKRTIYGQTIIEPLLAEKRKVEEEKRLQMEKLQEQQRQNRVVKKVLNVLEPATVGRNLTYANLTQKAGNRSRRNKRKNRKTRNKNFS